jgi:uncharacterized protein YjbI with pentapeptide repeats
MKPAKFKLGTLVVVGLLLFLRVNVTAEQLPKGDCNAPKPLTDLRHCVFWNKAFSGIDLHGTLLDGVSLRGTNLTGSNLSGASLRRADLRWSDFSKCQLTDTDFSNSNLFHTTFDGATMDRAKLNKAYMFGSRLNDVQARQADFTDAFMKDLNIENMDETWFQHAINLPIHLQQMLSQ